MMKLFVHKKTISYTDFGSPLGTETGIAWSTTGKAYDAQGFERGKTIADAMLKCAEQIAAGQLEVLVGEPVSRVVDMNPHGSI